MPSLDLALSRRSVEALARRSLGDSDTLVNLLIVVLGLVFSALLLVMVLFLIRRMRRANQMRADTLPAYQKDWNRSRGHLHGHQRQYSLHATHSSSPRTMAYSPPSSPTIPSHLASQQQHVARNPRRLTITTASASGQRQSAILLFGADGTPMLSNPRSPPHSPDNVPAIHITFPDEQDEHGQPKSGRVVVVRVGEGANATVGLSPVQTNDVAASHQHDEQLPAYEKETSAAKPGFYSLDLEQLGGLREKERVNWR